MTIEQQRLFRRWLSVRVLKGEEDIHSCPLRTSSLNNEPDFGSAGEFPEDFDQVFFGKQGSHIRPSEGLISGPLTHTFNTSHSAHNEDGRR
jgi:hypothetical protein